MTKRRKRISPEGPYDAFYDLARSLGYVVHVRRWLDDEKRPLLQVIAMAGRNEFMAPSVLDVSQLGTSVAGLHEQIEREETR
jgi:hypothetical protein